MTSLGAHHMSAIRLRGKPLHLREDENQDHRDEHSRLVKVCSDALHRLISLIHPLPKVSTHSIANNSYRVTRC